VDGFKADNDFPWPAQLADDKNASQEISVD
jgi:hypothetical protein